MVNKAAITFSYFTIVSSTSTLLGKIARYRLVIAFFIFIFFFDRVPFFFLKPTSLSWQFVLSWVLLQCGLGVLFVCLFVCLSGCWKCLVVCYNPVALTKKKPNVNICRFLASCFFFSLFSPTSFPGSYLTLRGGKMRDPGN